MTSVKSNPKPNQTANPSSIRNSILSDIKRLEKIIRRLEMRTHKFSINDVAEELDISVSHSMFCFMEKVISELKQNGKLRTSETYTSALHSFKMFRNGADISLECITPSTMTEYEYWLQRRGLKLNSIGFYTRILRAVYNRAVQAELINDRHPFKSVYTGVDKTIKRALPLSTLRRIVHLNLTSSPRLDYARDMFLISLYLRGMSFIDMAYLKKSDLCGGYIRYRRHKTGQGLSIRWMPEMQAILNKYPENQTDYLLPIITDLQADPRNTYRNKSYTINRNLKKIASMLHMPHSFTLYAARHTWASIARAKGVPMSVISQGMGHDSESTTRIYLSALDTSSIDKANAIILKSIK